MNEPRLGAKFKDLLARARAGCMNALGTLLQCYRAPLLQEAGPRIPLDLQGKVSASDLVQETCREGQANLEQFTGTSEEQWYAWLRAILRHNLLDAIRWYRESKREAGRETELSDRENGMLAAESAESEAVRREQEQRLKDEFEALDERKRQIIDWRLREGYTFVRIGLELGCSADAARKIGGASQNGPWCRQRACHFVF